ncbi:MAG TPA: NAD(P)(+) transhydrogenase (Re/Si-specific) subunit beta [Longimicrobiales bacterium]
MAHDFVIQMLYLVAAVSFVLGIKYLGSPLTARRGMHLAEIGMVAAVVGTLLHHEIVHYQWIVGAMIAGSIIGALMAILMPMTAVPQRTAISHMFGAIAAVLVGVVEYHRHAGDLSTFTMAALGFEVLFGTLTITGSFMAFGKLQGFIPSPPLTYPLQNATNLGLFVAGGACWLWLIINPAASTVFYVLIAIAFVVGTLAILPIGGADMPVVLSLLNSYAGLAASATGLAISNNVLIIAGALDGASGFYLSVMMSKAMNRSFTNVLFGAFGSVDTAAITAAREGKRPINEIHAEDAALSLAYARKVIIVPGYGLAVSQAQHDVRELADAIEKRGGDVRYAIHPVAGRMPGHMNVLLAEANVPYDKIYDMEHINEQFSNTDVAIVIGANDVVNPAANNTPGSPIYGMPILHVSDAKSVFVLKRSMNPGFAGIENELFYEEKTRMLFGDAKASLKRLVAEIRSV